MVYVLLTLINNCVTKWKLGAWDILKLALLAARSKMKTASVASKTWQPNHKPPCHSCEGGGRRRWKAPKSSTQNAPYSRHTDKLALQLKARGSNPTHVCKKQKNKKQKSKTKTKTNKKKETNNNWQQSLLVVNSVKFHLASLKIEIKKKKSCNPES